MAQPIKHVTLQQRADFLADLAKMHVVGTSDQAEISQLEMLCRKHTPHARAFVARIDAEQSGT